MTATVNPKQQMAEYAVYQQRLAEDTVSARLRSLADTDRSFLNEELSAFRPATLTQEEVQSLWSRIRQHEQTLTDWLIDTTTALQLELGGHDPLMEYINNVSSAFTVVHKGDASVIDAELLDWLVDSDTLKTLLAGNPWLLPLIAVMTMTQMLVPEKK